MICCIMSTGHARVTMANQAIVSGELTSLEWIRYRPEFTKLLDSSEGIQYFAG